MTDLASTRGLEGFRNAPHLEGGAMPRAGAEAPGRKVTQPAASAAAEH